MADEISFREKEAGVPGDGGRDVLEGLESKIEELLKRYEELEMENERLASALRAEREKGIQLQKKLELLTEDREKVRARIDSLLHRLKGVDL